MSSLRTSLAALFAAQALATSATTSGVVLASILAEKLSHSTAFSGVPSTLNMVCSSLSAALAGQIMAKYGRRMGLGLAFFIGMLGAILAFWQAISGSFAGFLLGIAIVGFANGGIQQGRYAVAELVPAHKRGWVMGLFLTSSAVGGVFTRLFMPSVQHYATTHNLPANELSWVLSATFMVLACGLVLLFFTAPPVENPVQQSHETVRTLKELFQHNTIRLAVLGMTVGQGVMVMLMVMMPVHATHLGYNLVDASTAVTWHVVGMFGLAWITGQWVDKYGAKTMILWGSALLVVACILGLNGDNLTEISVSLFILGVGWNLAYVAGSNLLTNSLKPFERAKVQGKFEFFVLGSGALGAVGGSSLVAVSGFSGMYLTALAIVLVVVVLVWRINIKSQSA